MGARGALIAYASAPGAQAEDGPDGRNSFYTRALAEEMMVPGVEVEQMFKTVRMRVLRDTKGRQVPWVNTSLMSDFKFNPAAPEPSATERALYERVQLLESQLAREQQLLASANERIPQAPTPAPAAATAAPPEPTVPTAASKVESHAAPSTAAIAPAAASASPQPAAVERIDRLQAELEATRQDLVSSNAPPTAAMQAAAKEALASAAENTVSKTRRLLRKDELEKMFVGKNQTFIFLPTGVTWKWYVRGDGNVFFKNQKTGRVGYGQWKLADDGGFCVEWWWGATGKNCMFYFEESGKTIRTNSPDLRSRTQAQILDIQ